MAARLINIFRTVPRELFRVNNGPAITLREWRGQGYSYDVVTESGMVKPKALDAANYNAPNGASMRPDGDMHRRLIQNFKGSSIIVYSVPANTPLPPDLILVHEHTDHYSLQAATEMSLADLNQRITSFLGANARVMSREQWLQAYSQAAGPSSTPDGWYPANDGTNRQRYFQNGAWTDHYA
ncbi:hypothetical protein EJ05DRAFT_446385 [Pseudovirgaria hyperparasitica]|uniref:Tse2 ADP-ribosyltransferase toxin domain-containing protein n=1 Tax=Pseudovirgaria hyperparasitica TaxID=470096 RepID=A0A6A6VPX7_9PEZI|nr:uncharacterized protein EJ05DRAFT_446385 [Pseudovirgaria hyperparasitica]KAF2752698.1 hypothetical protein EJ05DRAFT_446385 [Pseudovirgaria hyperparasitica]